PLLWNTLRNSDGFSILPSFLNDGGGIPFYFFCYRDSNCFSSLPSARMKQMALLLCLDMLLFNRWHFFEHRQSKPFELHIIHLHRSNRQKKLINGYRQSKVPANYSCRDFDCGYFVSRCSVCFFKRGQYFINSKRSGFVRLFFVVI